MPRKERTNAKTWERERRNRMNIYFKNLADLLPPNQEGKNMNKVDILIQASKYIKELNNRTEELFHAHAGEAQKEELNRLKKLVTQFYSRTQLLSALLKKAGITVPAEPALEKITPLKWSNKMNVEETEKYIDRFIKEHKSEKRRSKSIGIKAPSKKKLNGVATLSLKKPTTNKDAPDANSVPVEDRENHVSSIVQEGDKVEDTGDADKNSESRNHLAPVTSSDCGTSKVAGPKSAAGIRKLESRKKIKRKIKQVKTKKVKPLSTQSQSITNLVPGTLILSGGKIMPLVTPITSNILVNATSQAANPIILGNNQANPMIVMQPLVNRIQTTMVPVCNQNVVKAVQKVTLNTVPSIRANVGLNSHDWVSNVKTIIEATKFGGRKGILPKGKEITKTTMAYKVPIPAVHRETRSSKTADTINVEKSDTKNKIKRPAKSKKTQGKSEDKKDIEKSEAMTSDEAGRKRKISSKTDCSPSKRLKILSDTCQSIENLRHVIEKIGDNNNELPKNSDQKNEKMSLEMKNTKVIAQENTTSGPIEESNVESVASECQKDIIESQVNDSSSKSCEVPQVTLETISKPQLPKSPLKLGNKNSLSVQPALPLAEVMAEAEDSIEKFDNILHAPEQSQVTEDTTIDSTKIILNLDTNTTTTMKPDSRNLTSALSQSISRPEVVSKVENKPKESLPKSSLSFNADNTFIPINRTEALHSDLSNDLFASLQVPSSSHNPESISPTAAFLMAFPLVSSLNGKTEVLEEDMKEDLKYHSQTPPMLLQIGTIEPNSFKVKSINNDENRTTSGPEKIVSKPSDCQSAAKISTETTTTKSLPRIMNSETFKERVYKVVPYVETPKKNPELDTTLLSSSNCGNRDKKISQKPEAGMLCPSKYVNDIVSSSGMNDLARYPLPEFVPNYSTFPNSSDHMLPADNPRIYATSQPPASQGYDMTQQHFINRSKDNNNHLINSQQSISVTDRHNYQSNSLPSSQSLQYNYSSRSIHDSQPSFIEPQNKNDTLCTMSPDASQSTYTIHGKENATQMPYQEYSIASTKSNTTALDSATQLARGYIPPAPTAPPLRPDEPSLSSNLNDKNRTNSYQGYSTQSKQTIDSFDIQREFTPKDSFVANTEDDQRKLGNNARTKTQESDTAKIPEHFGHSQNYISYPREQKKMFDITNQSNAQISKSHSQQTSSLLRYPHQGVQQQEQQSCVATSNYSQSTATDNLLGKPTTTIAHNSSNFGLLWTTSSSNSGVNNNIVQFEANNDHVDETEAKTICENFNYPILHKLNAAYGNVMPAESFSADATIVGVDKSKSKCNNDKQATKNVQVISSVQKPSRNHNIDDDFKFSGDKNKTKFPIDSAYTQTEFPTVDQRHQHSTVKSHQIGSTKPEKSMYISGYDSQVPFDITEGVTPTKCSADIYSGTNYNKYPSEKTDSDQLKYQPVLQNSQQNVNKSKPIIQQSTQQTARRPVNWMMTPEIKSNTNIPDLILPPIGKELEFCPNNLFGQTSSYNQSTSNQFYNNYDVTVSAAHTFSNVSGLQTDSRRITDGYYAEDQHFSWSPTKIPQVPEQTMKTMDQQVVPSTLPTLVGDLALGTNIPEKQNFLFGQMPPRPSNDLSKSTIKDKEVGREFQVMLNTQTPQHTGQSGSFLSVSQLVDLQKEKSHHQQSHHPHHHHQQTQPQPRKHQRKGNTSPRTTSKRQMELRKQNDQLQSGEEQKVPSVFAEQTYQQPQQQQQQQQSQQQQAQQQQQPKYQQNDGLWRNRNCKSNYTAEALIGVNNTSVHDTNNTDKQLHPAIKFSADYSQNKFPSSLSTSEMMVPPMNYLPNPEDANGYGQVMNQNFNHSSYTYSPNTNIYPTTNFIASISNTPSSYMMPLHDNATDYLETNAFLLPNVNNVTTAKSTGIISSSSTTRTTSSLAGASVKNHQHYGNSGGKHQNCADKRSSSYSAASKKSKRKTDSAMHNLDFALAPGISTAMDDYHPPPPTHHHHHHHHHASTFLPPPHANLYQNHSVGLPANSNRRVTSSTANSVAMAHHPSGTSFTNFNLSTILPEMNDKVGYKPSNVIAPGLTQSNHSAVSYPQRTNYSTNNSIGHVPQVSEATQFSTDLPTPAPSVLHYKAT